MATKQELSVVSTMTQPVTYNVYARVGGAPAQSLAAVTVRGGVGLIDKRGDTLAGIGTPITPEQAEILRKDPVFRIHEKNGFVKIVGGSVNAENEASNMGARDSSSPLVDSDFTDEGSSRINGLSGTGGIAPPKSSSKK